MSSILYMSPPEAIHARTLKPGDTLVVVRPLKEQPPACEICGGDGEERCNNPDHGFIEACGGLEVQRLGCPVCGHSEDYLVPNGGDCWECGGLGVILPKLRYPVGLVLAGKEAWTVGMSDDRTECYLYKADIEEHPSCYPRWRSSATMPADAVCRRFKVVENSVDKLDDLTSLDWIVIGLDVIDTITAQYGADAWDSYTEILTLEVQ